jgi:hypothetical protein
MFMQPQTITIGRPDATEHDPYYTQYVSLVGDGDIVRTLESQIGDTINLLSPLTAEQASRSYEPGKWTIKQVIGHLTDAERIFAYRMLRIARNDRTPIEGFDQDPYVLNGPFEHYPLPDLVAEFRAVREATLQLLRHFDADGWRRSGIANGKEISVRALAYITAGHELHHRKILSERYLRP